MLLNLEIPLGDRMWRSKRRGSSANNRDVDIRIAGTICKLAEYISGWRILVGLRTSYMTIMSSDQLDYYSTLQRFHYFHFC